MKSLRTHKTELEAIRHLMEALGAYVEVRHQSGRIFGSRGTLDLYIQFPHGTRARQPFAFFFEVKVGRDKLRPEQAAFIWREENIGGRECVVGGLAECVAFVNPKLTRPISF